RETTGGPASPVGEGSAELSAGDEAVDDRGSRARQPARITVAGRQGCGARQTAGGADPGGLRTVRGTEALCERDAGIRMSMTFIREDDVEWTVKLVRLS